MVQVIGLKITTDNALAILFLMWTLVGGFIGYYATKKAWGVQKTFRLLILSLLPFLLVFILSYSVSWYIWLALTMFCLPIFFLAYRAAFWRVSRMESIYGKEYWKREPYKSRPFSFDLVPGTNESKILKANKALKTNPNSTEAWYQKAAAFQSIGDSEQAKICLAKAKELDNNPEL